MASAPCHVPVGVGLAADSIVLTPPLLLCQIATALPSESIATCGSPDCSPAGDRSCAACQTPPPDGREDACRTKSVPLARDHAATALPCGSIATAGLYADSPAADRLVAGRFQLPVAERTDAWTIECEPS
jgi:hypothetical protein